MRHIRQAKDSRVGYFTVFGLCAALSALLLAACGRNDAPSAPMLVISNAPSAVALSNSGAEMQPAATTAKPEFQKLKGKWLRPDGGYVLEIKTVDGGGRMEAAYFNPRPIHVARAEASQDGGVTKVFIELRDVNYPGSTYTLTFDPAGDQLHGVYFQALEQQRYEVVFVRAQ
jgi:hypothetical protein